MSAPSGEGDSLRVVVAALAGNLLIAISKFAAAFVTGSMATLAEAVHSVADCANQVLLMVGLRRSERPPTILHPFGHAVESYFWPFMVSILIFLVGGAFAAYEGIHGLIDVFSSHHVVEAPPSRFWSYAVLGSSFAFESYSFSVAFAEFRKMQGSRSLLKTLMHAKDPTIPVVLAEDTAALFGLAIALLSVGLADLTGWEGFEAIGSLLIGILLGAIAFFLASRTHSLLVGEAATPEDRQKVEDLVKSVETVKGVRQLLSYHLGPRTVILALKVELVPGIDLAGVEDSIDRIELAIRKELPHMRYIFIEPDTDYRVELDPERPQGGDDRSP